MSFSSAELAQFARECLGERDGSQEHYTFRVFGCSTCDGQVFVLNVEHHTGSEINDFRGVIRGHCVACSEVARLYTLTGEHRQPVGEDAVVCNCGSDHFIAAECERFEGEEGLPGFFDEGVVVTYCVECGENSRLVMVD